MNNESPTNTFGGMYNNIPPNPIGNIMNIGGQGYYNNNYNYYNPYLFQRQLEIQQAQQREILQQQSNIWKTISKNCNSAAGNHIENMDEHLKMYDPVEIEKHNSHEHNYNKLVNLNNNGIDCSQRMTRAYEAHVRMYEQEKQKYPDDMTLFDYCAQGGEQYATAIMNEAKEQQKNVTKLYDSKLFKNLVNQNSPHNITFTQSTNIDDMEITLPNSIATEFQRRKKAFLESILQK